MVWRHFETSFWPSATHYTVVVVLPQIVHTCEHKFLKISENWWFLSIFKIFEKSMVNTSRYNFCVPKVFIRPPKLFLYNITPPLLLLGILRKFEFLKEIAKNCQFHQNWRRRKAANSLAGNGRKNVLWLKRCTLKYFEVVSYRSRL